MCHAQIVGKLTLVKLAYNDLLVTRQYVARVLGKRVYIVEVTQRHIFALLAQSLDSTVDLESLCA